MSDAWEYRRERGEPDLEALGAAGWKLVAMRGEEWIFRRPAPSPAERFTAEQRDRALADPEAHRQATRHLLHPEVAALIRRVNHTQMLLLADRGFPIPPLPHVIDLALVSDVPTIPQVLAAILPDLPLDRVLHARELFDASPGRAAEYGGLAPREAPPHSEFKRLAAHAVGCIRTGDSTPYANLLLVGG